MLPMLALALLAAGGAGASAVGSSISARKNRKTAEQQTALDREQKERELGFQESMADPFRQQMAQATDLRRLDQGERSSFTPVGIGAGDGYMPTFTGGTDYTKSPELIDAFRTLKQSVLSGQTAPAFSTAPGARRPSVLDLVAMANQGQPGGQPPAPIYGGPNGSMGNGNMRPPGDFGADEYAPDDYKNPNRYRTTTLR